jgi:hypothetical protein
VIQFLKCFGKGIEVEKIVNGYKDAKAQRNNSGIGQGLSGLFEPDMECAVGGE